MSETDKEKAPAVACQPGDVVYRAQWKLVSGHDFVSKACVTEPAHLDRLHSPPGLLFTFGVALLDDGSGGLPEELLCSDLSVGIEKLTRDWGYIVGDSVFGRCRVSRFHLSGFDLASLLQSGLSRLQIHSMEFNWAAQRIIETRLRRGTELSASYSSLSPLPEVTAGSGEAEEGEEEA